MKTCPFRPLYLAHISSEAMSVVVEAGGSAMVVRNSFRRLDIRRRSHLNACLVPAPRSSGEDGAQGLFEFRFFWFGRGWGGFDSVFGGGYSGGGRVLCLRFLAAWLPACLLFGCSGPATLIFVYQQKRDISELLSLSRTIKT
jgi:hypothetical protein